MSKAVATVRVSTKTQRKALMKHVRRHLRDDNRHYSFTVIRRQVTTDGKFKPDEQTLFATYFLIADVSALAWRLDFLPTGNYTYPQEYHYGEDAPKSTIAEMWDTWVAENAAQPGETLIPLNAYTRIGELCQVFAVQGSQDGEQARRVLINVEYLRLLVNDADNLDSTSTYTFTIVATGRVCVRNTAGDVLGFVMPVLAEYEDEAPRGQCAACPTCGGDGCYHPVQPGKDGDA